MLFNSRLIAIALVLFALALIYASPTPALESVRFYSTVDNSSVYTLSSGGRTQNLILGRGQGADGGGGRTADERPALTTEEKLELSATFGLTDKKVLLGEMEDTLRTQVACERPEPEAQAWMALPALEDGASLVVATGSIRAK
ncbi:hypothetical protein DFH09DRAFT_1085773 [Mycena vulgaris]|nr:hypothetical protein DFH09DRAFT_1085773 [Mycena vulgaris]